MHPKPISKPIARPIAFANAWYEKTIRSLPHWPRVAATVFCSNRTVNNLKGDMKMERRNLIALLSVLVILSYAIAVAARDRGDLAGLARIKSGFKTKRISSYDRTGGNNDRF